MSTKEQATMEFEVDLHDDNITVIRKQIELLRRQVRETGDPEAQKQLAVAHHNYGVLRAQELAQHEKAVLTSLEDVENALVACGREQILRRPPAQAVEANRLAVDLANEGYTQGLVDFLNVLESQRQIYTSEDQLVQRERARHRRQPGRPV